MEGKRRDRRQDDVGGGAGQRHPDHVEPGMVKVPEIHRDRLGVAEQERGMRQQQHARQNHGAEGIDMLERVEADAAEFPGGIVAEPVCHKGVRGLVKGDRDEEGEYPDRDVVQRDVQTVCPGLRFEAGNLARLGHWGTVS